MTTIAITSADPRNPRRYQQVMASLGAEIRLLTPSDDSSPEALLESVGGLLLPGGPDVDPVLYGATPDPAAGLELCRPLDDLDLKLLDYALDRDMPVLAICRGMQLLNVARGGTLIQDLPEHNADRVEGKWVLKKHFIYLSPGAKTAAVIGNGGFFRVNSWHHQGLKEPQRSPRLMSTAYSMEDGIIEGLESPEHSWVIGLQCHPERQEEVPRSFGNLFAAFLDRAEMYTESLEGRKVR
ncbi:MAG: gamma-glutamyl-gamma-aminobutyrate hydrolase family protein [Dehalococcoidia bacterium]